MYVIDTLCFQHSFYDFMNMPQFWEVGIVLSIVSYSAIACIESCFAWIGSGNNRKGHKSYRNSVVGVHLLHRSDVGGRGIINFFLRLLPWPLHIAGRRSARRSAVHVDTRRPRPVSFVLQALRSYVHRVPSRTETNRWHVLHSRIRTIVEHSAGNSCL